MLVGPSETTQHFTDAERSLPLPEAGEGLLIMLACPTVLLSYWEGLPEV